MGIFDPRNFKVLESDNAKRKRLLAKQRLLIEEVSEFAGKNEQSDESAQKAICAMNG